MRGYLNELRAALGSRPLIVAGACVIVRDPAGGRVLLQRRADDGRWDLTGGSMEPGESFEQTARREAREELGVELGLLTPRRVYSGPDFYHRYPNGDEVYHVGVAFETHQLQGAVRPDPAEVADVGFFDLDALPQPITLSARRLLDDLDGRRPAG